MKHLIIENGFELEIPENKLKVLEKEFQTYNCEECNEGLEGIKIYHLNLNNVNESTFEQIEEFIDVKEKITQN